MAFLPAHNEESCLADALNSLAAQSRPPERIIVVADNCTDRTAEIAVAHGAEVIITRDNVHKKAGALNQAFADLLPTLGEDHLVMVMDADCTLDVGFLEAAERHLRDPGLGGVGGTFRGGRAAGCWAPSSATNTRATNAKCDASRGGRWC